MLNDKQILEIAVKDLTHLHPIGRNLHQCLMSPKSAYIVVGSRCAFIGNESVEQLESANKIPLLQLLYANATSWNYKPLSKENEDRWSNSRFEKLLNGPDNNFECSNLLN